MDKTMAEILKNNYGVNLSKSSHGNQKTVEQCVEYVQDIYDRSKNASKRFMDSAFEHYDHYNYGECTFEPKLCNASVQLIEEKGNSIYGRIESAAKTLKQKRKDQTTAEKNKYRDDIISVRLPKNPDSQTGQNKVFYDRIMRWNSQKEKKISQGQTAKMTEDLKLMQTPKKRNVSQTYVYFCLD